MLLNEFIATFTSRLEKLLESHLAPTKKHSAKLYDAMAHSTLNSGKRLRPLLVYATGTMLNAQPAQLDNAACAVEFIHTYSLIHDDLPAMDNADLRRGKPSSHKAFDEATAILAGDALLTLAFQILATDDNSISLTAEQRLAMINTLSAASGPTGMVAGQMLDIANMGPSTLQALDNINSLKTGALITASVKLGAHAANLQDKNLLMSLEKYAQNLGLAFQIQDDLIDKETHAEQAGKTTGLDATHGKVTYPEILGTNAAKEKLAHLYIEAIKALTPFGERAALLRNLASHLLPFSSSI